MWQRLSTMTVYVLEFYHKEYIASTPHFDEEYLSMFLQWHTIISYQLSHPNIKFHDTKPMKKKTPWENGSYIDMGSRFFYAIQDEKRYKETFKSQRKQARCVWAKGYVSKMWTWKIERFGPLKNSCCLTGNLWDKWVFWSKEILESCVSEKTLCETCLINSRSLRRPIFHSKEDFMENIQHHKKKNLDCIYWEDKMSALHNILDRNAPSQISSSLDVDEFTMELSNFMLRSSSKKLELWGTKFESDILQEFINDWGSSSRAQM